MFSNLFESKRYRISNAAAFIIFVEPSEPDGSQSFVEVDVDQSPVRVDQLRAKGQRPSVGESFDLQYAHKVRATTASRPRRGRCPRIYRIQSLVTLRPWPLLGSKRSKRLGTLIQRVRAVSARYMRGPAATSQPCPLHVSCTFGISRYRASGSFQRSASKVIPAVPPCAGRREMFAGNPDR